MYFLFSFRMVSNTHSTSMHDNDYRERRLFDCWKKWLSRPNIATKVVPFNYIKAMFGDIFKCHYNIPSD